MTRYADRVIHVDPLPGDSGVLREAIEAPATVVSTSADIAAAVSDDGVDVLLFNGNFNHTTDIQGLLEAIHPHVTRQGRVVVALYNWYFAWLYRLLDRLGLRHGPPITTFITRVDLAQLARLAGFELIRLRPVAYLPWHFLGVGTLVNVVMPAVPGFRWLSFVTVAVLRPAIGTWRKTPIVDGRHPGAQRAGKH